MTALITPTFHGTSFIFRADGWFNMTHAAKLFEKKLSQFWLLPSTVQYMKAVQEIGGISTSLKEVVAGRNGGTWAHPKLAVFFARWLDVKFSVWCDAVIEDILKGSAELVVTKPEDSALVQLQNQMGSLLRVAHHQQVLIGSLEGAVRELKERPAIPRPSMIQPPSLQAKPKDALMTIDAFFDEVKPEVQAYRRSRFAYFFGSQGWVTRRLDIPSAAASKPR
ncbi:MAG: KilA-N domain-containing protein [Aquabacterium sp.]